MPSTASLIPRLVLWGAAICSLFAGHVIHYELSVTDLIERTTLLEHTGHGHLPWTLPAAIALGLASAVVAAVLGYRRERGRGAGRSGPAPLSSVFKVASVQTGAFLLLETLERLVSGAPLAAPGWDALLGAVAIQVIGAGLAMFALLVLTRLGAAIARIPGSKQGRRTGEVTLRPPLTLNGTGTVWTGPFAPRGPPQLLTA